MSEQWAARFDFNVDTVDLPKVQEVVKQHNMRFVSNPAPWVSVLKRMGLTIATDDITNFNAGVEAIRQIIDKPKPEEVKKSFWQRLFG